METTQSAAVAAKPRSWVTAILLSLFLGPLGIDRFYLGRSVTGFLKLITAGGFGIWWFIDFILIAFNVLKDSNGLKLEKN